MRVGVIDVGSNTIRLLVADVNARDLDVVAESRVWARLGADVAKTGEISAARLDTADIAVSEFVAEAQRLGCERLEVLVASPGRQATNAGELVRTLERGSGVPVCVLGREDEARLGFHGAVAGLGTADGLVAVCDVGGGSTQLAVGLPAAGPSWLRSVDVGSLRLTTEALVGDPPSKKSIARARNVIGERFEGLVVPVPAQALAIGGSARAVRRLVPRAFGADELLEAASELRTSPSAEIASTLGVPRARAHTLLAGVLILAEVQKRFTVPFRVVGSGLREGAVVELAARRQAA